MFESPYPDVDVPDVTVYDSLFGDLSAADAERIAIIDSTSGAETSYGHLRDRVDAFAGALAARGVGPGSVVGLLCPNSPAFAVAFHGILRAGATATTINSLYTAHEIQEQLHDAGAEWLVTISPLLPAAAQAATALGLADDHVVVLDGAEGHPSLADLLGEGCAAPDVEIDPARAIAVLPYSSGTTGRAKGVMLTHRNLVANVRQCRVAIALTADDRVLAVLPFFHIYGMTVLLNLALDRRATLVTMPRFDLAAFLTAVQDHRCTFLFIAPPIAVALAKHPMVDEFDIATVHTVFSGAAPLDGATADAAGRRIGARVLQGYGMTELSPVSHAAPADRDDIPASSVGVLLPNVEAKLVDTATGDELDGDGEVGPGELWVRGPNVMAGYLNRADATAETVDAEGFLHTGDVAVRDAGGWYTIVDRVKELIKYHGYQIAPAELEALLLSHPQVADVAVIGVADDDGQEIPKAFVVAAGEVSAEDVMEYVAAHVAPHKKVRRVEFVDAIPKSTSGKILRKDLRAREG